MIRKANTMRHSFLKVLTAGLLVFFSAKLCAEPLQIPAIQVVEIEDSGSKRPYELYVRLPEKYDKNCATPYPVIYITDALWSIEVIAGAVDYVLEDTILVGVSWDKNSTPQRSRVRDFSPTKYSKEDYKHPTGEAETHINFLKNDVFALVEKRYHADPKARTFFGYSMGGLFGSYILLTQPNLFANYLIGGPSRLFDGIYITEHSPFQNRFPETINSNVYLAVGSDDRTSLIQNTLKLNEFLKPKLNTHSQLHLKIFESMDHKTAFPLFALHGLYWLNTHSFVSK